MLIYFTSICPKTAARDANNSYCNKLLQECLIMFRGAIYLINKCGKPPGYSSHPFTKWIASSEWAWDWLWQFVITLGEEEYPTRFPENQSYHQCYLSILELTKPTNLPKKLMEQTDLCPLPKVMEDVTADSHEERAEQFRKYICEYKNSAKWQFMFEPRTSRPNWMPKRTLEQDELVEKQRITLNKKLKYLF